VGGSRAGINNKFFRNHFFSVDATALGSSLRNEGDLRLFDESLEDMRFRLLLEGEAEGLKTETL